VFVFVFGGDRTKKNLCKNCVTSHLPFKWSCITEGLTILGAQMLPLCSTTCISKKLTSPRKKKKKKTFNMDKINYCIAIVPDMCSFKHIFASTLYWASFNASSVQQGQIRISRSKQVM
jgi:hypothetical protein